MDIEGNQDEEEFLECDVCGQDHPTEECPELGLSNSKFTPQISRARLTVPHYLNAVELPDGGIGILALEAISNKTQLGPFEAKKTMRDIKRDDLFLLKILTKDNGFISLDASCEAHCNWMSLVRVAQTEEEQNCMAYQLGISIYFNTTRDLAIGDELKVWYAPQYARKLKKSLVPDGKTKSMLGVTLFPFGEGDARNAAGNKDNQGGGSFGLIKTSANLHPEDVVGDYRCKHCGAHFTSQFLFAKHIREHLFPVYNYTEGPPRRGRRPVPLKIGESYGSGGRRGRPRGSGKLRGRGRGRGRPRRHPKMITVTAKGKETMLSPPSNDDDEDEYSLLEDAELCAEPIKVSSNSELDAEEASTASSSPMKTETFPTSEKKAKFEPFSEGDIAAESPEKPIPTAEKTLSSSRPRRSRRSIAGLGKLGKWLKYPGEESSDEETSSAQEGGNKLGRKKFGMAMAASLRKAARDEMTSPTQRRVKKVDSSTVIKTLTSSGTVIEVKKPKASESPKSTVVLSSAQSSTDLATALQGAKKILNFATPVSTSSGKKMVLLVSKDKQPGSAAENDNNTAYLPLTEDSPKKYIVITKDEESKAIAVPVSESKSESPIETSVELSAPTSGKVDHILSTAAGLESNEKDEGPEEPKPTDNTENASGEKEIVSEEAEMSLEEALLEMKNQEDAATAEEIDDVASNTVELTEQVETLQADSMTRVIELAEGEEQIKLSASIGENGEIVICRLKEGEEVDMGEVVLSNGGKDDVELGTQEEVIGIPQQKNTIADLDGSDALTALVNVAISADKVPDPIAMVAADIYDPQNAADDYDDTDEYKVRYKNKRQRSRGGAETADEDDLSRGDENGARKRRKKRKPGDDPELEELERRTKIVEGPNNTEEFACGICNKHFTQLKYLKLHLPAHTDRYRCKVCGKRFARNESLLKHTCDDTASLVEQTLDEEGRDAFTCRECGRIFSQLSFALRHASMHRSRFNCEKCGRNFLRQELLDEHDCQGTIQEEGEAAGGEGQHECQICKQSFSTGKYLFRHMAMHTDIYKCEKCGKCYSRKDSLQRHISRCCPELSDMYSVHVCPNCKKTFGTQLGLQNHMLNCGKYQCSICKVAYFSLKDLSEHDCSGKVLNDRASVQFPCKECNKTFASIAYLVRHEASHHGAFKCSICERVFIRKEELSWHMPVCEIREKIQQEGGAECPTCGEAFQEWLAFKDHHMTHTHPYKCDKCNKRFIKIGTLHNHKCEAVGEPGGDPNDQLSCGICQKTFKNERYLSRHLTLHGQPEFTCEFCGKFFTRKDYLNDHQCRLPNGTTVRMVRKKNRLFIKDNLACPVCNKTFSSRSNMMKHMKVHGDKQAECHICRKKFHYENYLKLHIATVHEKQYQLQCTHCGKVLFSKTGLIAHIKQFHADTIKLYPCPKCGKTFRQKGNMKTHLISHTKDRAYKCDVCNKAFKYPDQLNRHRLEHTLSQKYACELCDKQFVRTYELRNHMRNYHSGFVYVCGICHECCAHRHTIIRHYKRKHPEVGNVFEEKPEFIDSLQKPITAATQARMMLETDDIKPTIVRVSLPSRPAGSLGGAPHHQIMVAAGNGVDEDGTGVASFAGGELILQQTTDMVSPGDSMVQQVLEGPGGEQQTVFVLKVVNPDSGDNSQEMELTEETKAYLAQFLQQHSAAGQDITHIQVGDQTLQIQRQEGEEEPEDIKFDPSADMDGTGVIAVSSSAESMVAAEPITQERAVVASAGLEGMVTAAAVPGVEEAGIAGMAGVQVVEMEDGQLGRIIHMDESQMLEMAAGANAGIPGGQIFQMEGGQVIHLDHTQLMTMGAEDGHIVVSAADLVAAVQQQQQQHQDDIQQRQRHLEALPSVTVTKRRGLDGQIFVEVEGDDGKLMGLDTAGQIGGEQAQGAVKSESDGLQIAAVIPDQTNPIDAVSEQPETTATKGQMLQLPERKLHIAGNETQTEKNEASVKLTDSSATGSGQMIQIIRGSEETQVIDEASSKEVKEEISQENFVEGGERNGPTEGDIDIVEEQGEHLVVESVYNSDLRDKDVQDGTAT